MRRNVKPKLEAAWRQKSLERLEKSIWPQPDFDSSIIRRALRLRTVPLGDLLPDDTRFLLGQQMGLPYTLELAMELLSTDLLLEAGYYPGDLLRALMRLPSSAREAFPYYFEELARLALPRIDELRTVRPQLPLDTFFN